MPANWTTPVTWNTGQLVTAANLNEQLRDNLEYLKQSGYAILIDQKAQNTQGGTSVANAWTTRDIQTEVIDTNSIVTLGTNQFIPIAGNYRIHVTAPINNLGTQNFGARIRLRNITTSVTVNTSPNVSPLASDGTSSTRSGTLLTLQTLFTANGSDAYGIQYYCNAALATTGLGLALNESGAFEIYTTVLLEKLS